MIPVMQTSFGEDGNCFEACVASILEIPLEEVVKLNNKGTINGKHWQVVFNEWLNKRGLWSFAAIFDGNHSITEILEHAGYSIISGYSSRSLMHSTVWLGSKMVHDPHPSGNGIKKPEDIFVIIPFKYGRFYDTKRGD